MADAFRPHPAARIFGPDGAEVPAADAAAVIPADRGAAALRAALAHGAGFRIGLPEAPPPAPQGFETLTSGSTGAPRRIRRSVASWTASFAVNAGLFGIGPGSRVAVLGALVHSLSLYGALEGACLGAGVHLLAGLRPDRQAAVLVATARPRTPSQPRLRNQKNRAEPRTTVTITLATAKIIGRRVS